MGSPDIIRFLSREDAGRRTAHDVTGASHFFTNGQRDNAITALSPHLLDPNASIHLSTQELHTGKYRNGSVAVIDQERLVHLADLEQRAMESPFNERPDYTGIAGDIVSDLAEMGFGGLQIGIQETVVFRR